MLPLTLLATQKLRDRLTAGDALSEIISASAEAAGWSLPTIPSAQVFTSAASQAISDDTLQLTYPRVCIYSTGISNLQAEKFRSFSGQVALTAEVWASADLVTEVDEWIHIYVGSVTEVLRKNIGDWGDGMFYGGAYDVQFQAPKHGGLGFVEVAKLNLTIHASAS
jgi:hypothetical protein